METNHGRCTIYVSDVCMTCPHVIDRYTREAGLSVSRLRSIANLTDRQWRKTTESPQIITELKVWDVQ